MSAESNPQQPRLLDHDCDGIREYDNPMPLWWTAILWVSVILSLPYFVFYHAGGVGSSAAADYETEVGEFYEMQSAKLGDLQPDAATILTLAQDTKKLLGGRNMFKVNCSICHGPDGGGKTGPNLSDDYYLNIKQPEDIVRVLRDGLESKGMPKWGKRFSGPQLVLLASYVVSLRGTKPASPREPQGDRVAVWAIPPAAAAATSAASDAAAKP